MRAAHVHSLLIAGALGLGGCSTGTFLDDVGTIWGDESTAETEERQAALNQVQVPIQAVRSVEMGRTRDGFLITAYGTAAGLGFSKPALRARRAGAPGADGYIEFDFVAFEPAPGFNLPPGNTQTRSVRADLPVPLGALQGALGLRVLSLTGGVQMDF